jgi:hypothetical protein
MLATSSRIAAPPSTERTHAKPDHRRACTRDRGQRGQHDEHRSGDPIDELTRRAARPFDRRDEDHEHADRDVRDPLGIDLFLVRDLTDQEWGLPGRVVWVYMQLYTAEIHDLKPEAVLLATVSEPPTNVALDLHIRPDGQQDPELTLHDTNDGSAGPNLLGLLYEVRHAALARLAPQVGLLDGGVDAARSFIIPLEIELAPARHRDLHRAFGIVRLERLRGELHVLVNPASK